MSALQIEPTEGMVAIEFLDDGDDEGPASEPNTPTSPMAQETRELCYAICVGIGKTANGNTPVCKRGDTVLVDPYARNGFAVGDNVVLTEAWYVKAVVKTAK